MLHAYSKIHFDPFKTRIKNHLISFIGPVMALWAKETFKYIVRYGDGQQQYSYGIIHFDP